MNSWEGSQLNQAKEILAFELTKMVHGGRGRAKKAQEGARALFGAGADTANMPTTQLADEDFTDGQIAVLRFAGENRPGRFQGRGPQAHPAGRADHCRRKGDGSQQNLRAGRVFQRI